MKAPISHNIAANVATRAWGFASAYLFVPIYLRLLGIEAYGLVGFYSTLLAVMSFADMGLTATLNRELARLSARDGALQQMRDLLRSFESIYLAISATLAIGLWTLAPWIAERWLTTVALRPAETALAIRLLGFSIVLQLPTSLYLGGLMGLERQVRAAYLQVGLGALRGVGTVVVLWWIAPTIVAFAWWQLITNAIGLLAIRGSLWRALSPTAQLPRSRFSRASVAGSWRYAAGMAGMAALTVLQTQVDRLALSKMVTLEKFAYYSLAGALASVPILIGGAIAGAVFPRLTALVAAGDRAGTVRLYHRFTGTMSALAFPVAVTLAAYSDIALYAWTGSRTVAAQGALVTRLLLAGQLMQVVMSGPYYLDLAYGRTRLTLYFALGSVAVVVPLLLVLIPRFGIAGAGLAWLAMNVAILPAYAYLIHKQRLPGQIRAWIAHSVALPLFATVPVALLGRWLMPEPTSRLAAIGQISVVCTLSIAACVATVPGLTREALRRLRMLRTGEV